MRPTCGTNTARRPVANNCRILQTDRRRDSRLGRHAAALFRQRRLAGIGRRCDVEDVCRADDLEVLESRIADPGYTACLFCDLNGTGGAIFLSPKQDAGRRRFSLAHEIGHYHLPTHRQLRQQGVRCGEAAMRAGATDAAQMEWEANDFASELLMPARLFGADADRRDFSVATARELASDEYFDVSVTAAACRMTQLSTQPCAIVMSSNGKVHWARRSAAMRIPGLRRGMPIGTGTVASASKSGGTGEMQPLEVDVEVWLEPRYPVHARLLESTHIIGTTGQVLSMLWLAEVDSVRSND
jgi:Zn-dependent peptidase ImmA (M78 family)